MSHTLKSLLRNASFHDISHHVVALEASPGVPEFDSWREGLILIINTFRPYLLRAGVTTEEESQMLLDQALQDMEKPDFCNMTYLFFVWGVK